MKKAFVIVGIILVIAGLILSRVLVSGVIEDPYTGGFEIADPATTVLVSTTACAAAALLFVGCLWQSGSSLGGMVYPILSGFSLTAFGVLYGLFTNYHYAANVLSNYLENWGWTNDPSTYRMPEFCREFESAAENYGIAMGVALVAFFLFCGLAIVASRKSPVSSSDNHRDFSID